MKIEKLRKWHTDPEVAVSSNVNPSYWTFERPERPMLDKARDAASMLFSFVSLQQEAMFARDSGEPGDNEEQVSIEAAQLALQYCEELVKMAQEAQGKRK